METTDSVKIKDPWLGLTEFITIMFAFAILMGRIYSQSYWKAFGLSPELVNTDFVNYAIASPNTAVASVVMAASCVILIKFITKPMPDLVTKQNSKVAFFIGDILFAAGLGAIGIIPNSNLSTWPAGTAGLAFGVGFFCFNFGHIVMLESSFKQEQGAQPRWIQKFTIWFGNRASVKFLKKKFSNIYHGLGGFPFTVIQILVPIALAASSMWGMIETAQKFGIDEAYMAYDNRPVTIITLDSQKGFEDLVASSNSSGSPLLQVKIIGQSSDFLYVSPGYTKEPFKMYLRAIPLSRVQAIQYTVDIVLLNK